MRQLKTIKLSGKDYAQVAERLRAVHEDHPEDLDIITSYDVTPAGSIVFTATLTLYFKDKERTYTGHSFGKLAKEKSFEKLETIALGRALAFAGYHANGEIASADEMQEHAKGLDTEAIAGAIGKIQAVTTVAELNKAYKAMPLEVRQNKEVIEAGKEKKKALTTIRV